MAGGGWLIELTTREALRGGPSAPRALAIEARPGSHAASLVENFRPNFERAHLIVFARRFARANERERWHVRAVADTAEIRELIARPAP